MESFLVHPLQASFDEDPFGQQVQATALPSGTEEAMCDELNAPEYSTDEFRMFQFKVERCTKRCVHDWRACPFAHPTENARRRDPRLVQYLPIPCPEYKRGICLRGDACAYAHGVYECWLHPAKYRTQLCKEGPVCRRPVCFFAHAVQDLRQSNQAATTARGGPADFASPREGKAGVTPAAGTPLVAPQTPEPSRAAPGGSGPSSGSPAGRDASLPRMSNAVARKLGLAPARTARDSGGAKAGGRGGAAPTPPPAHAAAPHRATAGTIPAAYGSAGDAGALGMLGIHPALLSLVASNLQADGTQSGAPADTAGEGHDTALAALLAGLAGCGLGGEGHGRAAGHSLSSRDATPTAPQRASQASAAAAAARWGPLPASAKGSFAGASFDTAFLREDAHHGTGFFHAVPVGSSGATELAVPSHF